ncbi:MAG: 4Fe-4S binding protein [Chloroflexota bacterium]
MPGKMALVHFRDCHPESCPEGVCRAVTACPHKLIKQEATYEKPMPDPALCRGCGDCARVCPAHAIEIAKV